MKEKNIKEELKLIKDILFIKKGDEVVWESQEYKECRGYLEKLEYVRYPEKKYMLVLNTVINTSRGSLYEVAVKCFAYGVMIGKHRERAKKKKSHQLI